MTPPDPQALTRSGDAELDSVRAATNGLTDRQVAEVALVLLLRWTRCSTGEIVAESMRVAGFPG